MSEQKYWVVEFRLPVMVDEASSPEDATTIAKRKLHDETGFDISAWFARVFLYDNEENGPTEEYFFNPAGTKARSLYKNYEEHFEKSQELSAERGEQERKRNS